MHEIFGWLLSALSAATLVAVGVTYGDARAKLGYIKEKLDGIDGRLDNHGNRIKSVELTIAKHIGEDE